MDTINVTYKFTRELSLEETSTLLFTERYIESIKASSHEVNKYYIGYSVPKFFCFSNARLIGNQSFNIFKNHILSLFKDITISAVVTRVDTPFTFWMNNKETFDQYSHIFRLLSLFYSDGQPISATKFYADTITRKIETFIFSNSSNINRSSNKIIIYNQAKKILDSDSTSHKDFFKAVVNKYPDLNSRIRIEVSRKTNMPLEKLSYQDQYQKSYNYLNINLFGIGAMEDYLEDLSDTYKQITDIQYEIFKGLIFDYNTYRKTLKSIITNERTLESKLYRLKSKLREFNLEHLCNITLKKVLPKIKKEFQRQITW